MKHLRITTYEITKGTFAEIVERTKRGLLPKFQEQRGFIRYGVADTGGQRCATISVWRSPEQAATAAHVAAEWVRENLGDRVELKSNMVGDLAYFEGAKEPVKA